jgi:phosphatidylserine/phosphatidylglycerophosphate/cardiolipin synthase-like enzyme
VRIKRTRSGLSVRAISGTYVVMLGINLRESDCTGLRGFAIHRADNTEGESYYLRGLKTFAATDPGFPPGASYSTRDHPIQGFGWSDYTAKPGHLYTYRVEALTGPPTDLTVSKKVEVTVATEAPVGGDHDIYFNRGVAASQAYATRFGNRRPTEVGQSAFDWLSRGLYEAILEFIAAATAGHGLRVAAYEFHYPGVLDALRAAMSRGVDVRIVYDARKDQPKAKNDAAVALAGLGAPVSTRRTTHQYISHNKFIVRLSNGVPEAVLTGGTNFSEGGIFGHSNVVHVVEDQVVAAEYLRYWNLLQPDPTNRVLKPLLTSSVLIPGGYPPRGTLAIFSPRSSTDALDFYARLAAEANDSLFMTFAFGMNPLFQQVYRSSGSTIRYAVLEKKTRPMARGPERDAAEAEIDQLRFQEENLFAIGSRLTQDRFDRWLAESDSGLNSNVKYVHNKFMLIDPLSSSPVVVAGSANFSDASSDTNDENMLVIRDNTRVADIYLGEFMRLYAHHAFREFLEREGATSTTATPRHLSLGEWWRAYFGDSSQARQRRLFSGATV